MDDRPPKRQRRSIHPWNDSQETHASTASTISAKRSLSRPRASERARATQTPSARIPSSSPSPRKSQSSPKTTKSQSLHSFFQPASEGQRWSKQKFETKRALSTVSENTLDADVIEDDYDSYDEIFVQHLAGAKADPTTVTETGVTSTSGRPQRPVSKQSVTSRPKRQPTKRFLMPSNSENKSSRQSPAQGQIEEMDRLPWAQRYAPLNLDEIAVHKRKVTDVQNWLEDSFEGKRKERLLVLRGPAGCGKTTTITLLSKSIGFDIVEWKNPAVSEYTTRNYISVSAQFEEFLARGDRFAGLALDDTRESMDSRNASFEDRRIILIEEFPTGVSRGSSSLSAFRSSLQRYLAASTDQGIGWHPPIVMIVSEMLLSSASSTSDNVTAHRLLGPTLYNHPSTAIIDFNSIAPTYMQKALRTILDKDIRATQRQRVPGLAVLERISEVGDIRSALSALEFLCLKDDHTGNWSGGLAKPKKSQKSRGDASLTPMEEESLKLISQRESSLGMFHAVGKIVYNKRLDPSLVPDNATTLPAPPDHLPQHRRPKVSQVAVNDLIDETGTDISTFVCALHENYPPSCDGSNFTDDLDACIEMLSDSDLLSADRKFTRAARAAIGFGTAFVNSSVDRLRQDEISFQVAARGLLFALPYPIKRRLASGHGRGRPGDAHKMLYPTLLRLWRKTEEIDGLLEQSMRQLLDPIGASQPTPRRMDDVHESAGVKAWKSYQIGHHLPNSGNAPRTVTLLSRSDALLYQLPYMVQIRHESADSWPWSLITRIRGSHISDEMDEDDPSSCQSHSQIVFPPPQARSQASGPPLQEEEKLILSDDEIVDD